MPEDEEPKSDEFQAIMLKYLEKVALEDEEAIALLRPKLNNEYWSSLLTLPEDLVSEPPFSSNLKFDKRQILFSSYGMPGFGMFDWEGSVESKLINESKVNNSFDIRLLPNALNESYRTALGLDKRLDVKARKSRVEYQIEVTVQYIRNMQLHCAALVQKHLSEVDAEEMMKLSSVYDDRIRPILQMEKQIKERGMSKKEDITRFAQMKEEVILLRQKRSQILDRHGKGKLVLSMFSKVERGYAKLLDLNGSLIEIQSAMNKTRSILSRVDVIAAIKDEIKHLKMLMNMTAQLCRMIPMSVPLAEGRLASPFDVGAAMEKILDFDPEIFQNRHCKRDGIPHVLIVPGSGNGMYDWAKNRLVIPTLSARNVLDNIATAIVMYRLDVDQQFSERKLIQSYKNDIKANREIRSIRKLRQTLVENYVTWVSKEAEGYAVLDKDVREWFEHNIGPKKNNVMIPRHMRGMSLAEINKRIEISATEAKQRNAQEFYELGVMFALKEEFKDAADCFAQSISVDPEYVNAYYSGGICFRKLRDKRGMEYLTEFIKRAPQSWWSKKAQELISQIS